MSFFVLYASDLHGNNDYYDALVKKTNSKEVDALVLGGDLFSKGDGTDYIEGQRKYILNDFIWRMKEIKKPVYLIMGNDDAKCNLDVLEEGIKGANIFLIHKKRHKLTPDIDIIGYSYVCPTPFGIKDWEKYDTLKDDKRHFRRKGFISKNRIFEEYSFPSDRSDNIENDLEHLKENAKSTIYVIHDPPYNTNLDLVLRSLGGVMYKEHIGSVAVRNFIEKYQPLLTLHGHIHESAFLSKKYTDEIGNTICVNPGQIGEKLSAVLFDVYDIKKTIRRLQ